MAGRLIDYSAYSNEVANAKEVDYRIHIQLPDIVGTLLRILVGEGKFVHVIRQGRSIRGAIELIYNGSVDSVLEWENVDFGVIVMLIDVDFASQRAVCSQSVVPNSPTFGRARMKWRRPIALTSSTQRASTSGEQRFVIVQDYGSLSSCTYRHGKIVDQVLDLTACVSIIHKRDSVSAASGGFEGVYEAEQLDGGSNTKVGGRNEEVFDVRYEEHLANR
jgi:hypothetical protein